MSETLFGEALGRKSGVEARAVAAGGLAEASLTIGTVQAVEGEVYTVALRDDAGAQVGTVERVRCVPYVSLAVGAVVWLAWFPGYGFPIIVGATGIGGAPTGYLQGVADLGFAGCLAD